MNNGRDCAVGGNPELILLIFGRGLRKNIFWCDLVYLRPENPKFDELVTESRKTAQFCGTPWRRNWSMGWQKSLQIAQHRL
jgi:hypothetical protein